MSEKDEVLQRLHDIKSTLDDQKFFPYNYNALIVWGVISIVLALFLLESLKNDLLYGTLFLVIMVMIGFYIEGFLIKKENTSYDIEDCTKKQKFIFQSYLLTSFFGIVVSALLAKYGLLVPIYMLWIFICGLGNFVVGYTINQKLFSQTGRISMILAICLMVLSIFITDLGSLDSVFARVTQVAAVFSLGLVPIYHAVVIKKEMKLV